MSSSNIDMLYIEYTTKCNSKCSTCDYWKNNSIRLDIDKEIIETIEKLYNTGLKVLLFTGGEALLEGKRLFNLANIIKEKFPKLERRILTNGILVEKYIKEIVQTFDSIVFSFDTIDEQKYINIRGVDAYSIVSNNIRKIREESESIEIRLRSMILKENLKELHDIVRFAVDTKVNKISFLLVDTDSNGFGRKDKNSDTKCSVDNLIDVNLLQEQIEKIKNIETDSGIIDDTVTNLKGILEYLKDGKQVYKTCNAPLNSIVINSTGDILPCFFMKKIGNIKENDIEKILQYDMYKEIYNKRKKRLCNECKKCVL